MLTIISVTVVLERKLKLKLELEAKKLFFIFCPVFLFFYYFFINYRRSRGFRRESSVFPCLRLKATGSPTKALGDDGFKFFRIATVPTTFKFFRINYSSHFLISPRRNMRTTLLSSY